MEIIWGCGSFLLFIFRTSRFYELLYLLQSLLIRYMKLDLEQKERSNKDPKNRIMG